MQRFNHTRYYNYITSCDIKYVDAYVFADLQVDVGYMEEVGRAEREWESHVGYNYYSTNTRVHGGLCQGIKEGEKKHIIN